MDPKLDPLIDAKAKLAFMEPMAEYYKNLACVNIMPDPLIDAKAKLAFMEPMAEYYKNLARSQLIEIEHLRAQVDSVVKPQVDVPEGWVPLVIVPENVLRSRLSTLSSHGILGMMSILDPLRSMIFCTTYSGFASHCTNIFSGQPAELEQKLAALEEYVRSLPVGSVPAAAYIAHFAALWRRAFEISEGSSGSRGKPHSPSHSS